MSESQERYITALDAAWERAAHRRTDESWLREQWSNSAEVIFCWRECNLFSLGPNKRPLFLKSSGRPIPNDLIFLGLRANGESLFAADLADQTSEADALAFIALASDQARFVPLRQYDGTLSAEERALLFYSRALTLWHREQKFCGRCGSPTRPEEAGHVMACINPSCAEKHFPRINPAIIMLVHSGERCLLGRQAAWPKGFYSTLAGFVEPGERLEEAVYREIKEESGLEVSNIHYFGSQPWPFPHSLMLGFFAAAETTQISRGVELEDVRWFELSEAKEFVRKFSMRFPHLDPIARRLIRHWVEATESGRGV
jgi:NAD+ diphosphatase